MDDKRDKAREPRFRCRNCKFVVGSEPPDECPVCHTRYFDDVAPLDDPQHPANRKEATNGNLYGALLLAAFGLAMTLAGLLGGGPKEFSYYGVVWMVFATLAAIYFYMRLRRIDRK